MSATPEPLAGLRPDRVAELLAEGRVQVVDVREPYEHTAGHIAGSHHLPLARLAAEAETLDRSRPVVFGCRVGARSALATRAFRRAGWDAYNLEGGMLAWADRGLPLAPEGGRVADH